MTELRFGRDGAQLFRCAFSMSEVQRMRDSLNDFPSDVAGIRLRRPHSLEWVLAAGHTLQRIAADLVGSSATPVRAVLFDKTERANWSLTWHQDRTIVVRDRREAEGFGPWSTKAGLFHVEPPFRVLERMATLRLHLDDVDEGNAPLLIAPGSHKLGRVSEADIPALVERAGSVSCLANAGDVWAYSTPILHASKAATRPRRRRVLQLDYSNHGLDNGLEWLGV